MLKAHLKRRLATLLCLMLVATLLLAGMPIASAQSLFDGGIGEHWNPYLISTPKQLALLNDFLGDTGIGYYFRLTQDIDLTEYLSQAEGNDSGQGWKPIGEVGVVGNIKYQNRFTANLDGAGHKITGLWINRPSSGDIGLFGAIGPEARISNLGVITSDSGIVGAGYVGALVGTSLGRIENCYTKGSVQGSVAGGLVGFCTSSTRVYKSYSSCDVSGANNIGGLVGELTGGEISFCHSSGNVGSENSNCVGGLVGTLSSGLNPFDINNTYPYPEPSYIHDSYSTGEVLGKNNVGGFIGELRSIYKQSVEKNYSAGKTTGISNVGGFIGNIVHINPDDPGYIELYDNFFDIDTTTQSASVGKMNEDIFKVYDYMIAGKTSEQMKNKLTYSTWSFGIDSWLIKESASYPYHSWVTGDPIVKVYPQSTLATIRDNVYTYITVTGANLVDANIFEINATYTGNYYNYQVLNGLSVIQSYIDKNAGVIKIILFAGSRFLNGEQDLIRIQYETQASTEASLTLQNVNVAGRTEDNNAYERSATLYPASANIKIYEDYYTICDINDDGAVTLADFSIVARYYGSDASQGNDYYWEKAKRSDINGDGGVYMADILIVHSHIHFYSKNQSDGMVFAQASRTKIVSGYGSGEIKIFAENLKEVNTVHIKGTYTGGEPRTWRPSSDMYYHYLGHISNGTFDITVFAPYDNFINSSEGVPYELFTFEFDSDNAQDISVTIQSAEFGGKEGEDEDEDGAYDGIATITKPSASIKVHRNMTEACDLTGDGKVSLSDLSMVARYYACMQGDADWSKAEHCDVNCDGCVDMADLIITLASFTD